MFPDLFSREKMASGVIGFVRAWGDGSVEAVSWWVLEHFTVVEVDFVDAGRVSDMDGTSVE
jgi:hypothetical protein